MPVSVTADRCLAGGREHAGGSVPLLLEGDRPGANTASGWGLSKVLRRVLAVLARRRICGPQPQSSGPLRRDAEDVHILRMIAAWNARNVHGLRPLSERFDKPSRQTG